MVQYIDKAAVVAEIERIKKEECPVDSYEGRCKLLWFEQFLSFLGTLEVKEVNLDGEINLWVRNLHRVPNFEELNKFARHFFKLGFQKAQKGE